jgi:hypothetical protein
MSLLLFDSSPTYVLYSCTDLDHQALSSNPKGPLDDHVAETAKKTVENVAGEIKK